MTFKKNTVIPLESVPKINWKNLKFKDRLSFYKFITKNGTEILYECDALGFYPIHWATMKNKPEIVEELIKLGVSPKMKANIYDEPQPIHLAAIEGNIEVINLLLYHGIDVNAKDTTGCTPLIRAAMFGSNYRVKSSETVLHLISCGSNMNETDNEGFNCLHYAILQNNEETVRLLLNLGMDPNLTTNKNLRALDFAIKVGNENLMRLLAPLTYGFNLKDLEVLVIKHRKKRCRDTFDQIILVFARIVLLFVICSALFWAYPQYILYYLPQSADYLFLHISIICLNALLWYSWYKINSSNPGFLPINTRKYHQILNSILNSGIAQREVNSYSDTRLCHTCRTVQTNRSTHCRFCKRCIASFDHHCIYLSTCIGYNNRLPFFFLNFFMCLTGVLGVMLVMTVARMDNTLFTPYQWINFCYCIKFAIIGGILTLNNIRRAAINLTQNEEYKSSMKRYRHLIGKDGKFYNPFDKGSYWGNIKEYFTQKPYSYTKIDRFDY